MIVLLVCALTGSAAAFSPAPDTSKVAATTAAAPAPATIDTGKVAAAPQATLISTDADTTLLSWAGGGPDAPKPPVDYTEEYKSLGYYSLLFLLFCAFLAIIGKVLRVYEVTKEIQGKPASINWNRVQSILFGIALVVGIYGVYWSYSVQGPMSVRASTTEHGKDLDSMFNITLVITTIVFILTHIMLFGFAYMYGGSNKRKAYFYPHNNFIERLWTFIPAVVLAILVIKGFMTWKTITDVPDDLKRQAISLEVTGEQFKWNIRYAGEKNVLGKKDYKKINSSNNLGIDYTDPQSWDDKLGDGIVLPVNMPVRVTVNSKDILHSFYVPSFKAQINAVPGMSTFFQFTPTKTTAQERLDRNDPKFDYILLCAKICGMGHYNMQTKVTVVTESEYKAWLAKQPLFYNDDVKKEMQAAAKKEATTNNKIALNK